MKIYKLTFRYNSGKDDERIECKITGILPSQVRQSFYKELSDNYVSDKEILKLWTIEKTNVKEIEFIYPIVKRTIMY